MMNKKFFTVVLALLVGGVMTVDAQGILNRIGNRIKNRVEDKVNRTVDNAVDGAVEGAVEEVTAPSEDEAIPAETDSPAAPEAEVNAGAKKNDFVRGSVVMFEDNMQGE